MINTTDMKKLLFTCILFLGSLVSAMAQEGGTLTATGTVLADPKEPMIGVNVSAQNLPGFGALTDIKGI